MKDISAKIRRAPVRARPGQVLIVTVWAMVLITVLAVTLGRRVQAQIQRARYSTGQWRAKKSAWEAVLAKLKIISRTAGKGPASALTQYGIMPEESKININTLPANEYRVLIFLLEDAGVNGERAKVIAAAVLDWRDADSEVFDYPNGAEDDFYRSLPRPYRAKNKPFESVEEILLVREVSPEIFQKINKFITVYPPEGSFRIDLMSAAEPVVKALARNFIGARTNTDLADADSLTAKIISRRGDTAGADLPGADDLGLNSRERVIYLAMTVYQMTAPEGFSFGIAARDEQSGLDIPLEITVSYPQMAVCRWRRVGGKTDVE